jgi:hypothetical protein
MQRSILLLAGALALVACGPDAPDSGSDGAPNAPAVTPEVDTASEPHAGRDGPDGAAARVAAEGEHADEHADEDADAEEEAEEEEEPLLERARAALADGASAAGALALLVELEASVGPLAERVPDEDERLAHLEILGRLCAELGEHRRALALDGAWRALVGAEPDRAVPSDGARAEPALAAVLALARDRRVVLVDDQRFVGQSRAFLCGLVDGLADLGFTHLALEAFDSAGLETLAAGGPPRLDQALALRDPLLAHVVARAEARGLVLFAHDRVHRSVPTIRGIADRSLREAYRAECAALHVADLLAADPNARILVQTSHAGLDETAGERLVPLAARIAREARLDPLTVATSVHGERADPTATSAAFALALERGSFAGQPIVFVDGDGAPWSSGGADVDVLLPPADLAADGRPDWLGVGGRRAVAFEAAALGLEAPTTGAAGVAPVLVLARRAGAADDRVAQDQCVWWRDTRAMRLFLAPGRHEVVVVAADGARRAALSVEVE